jgi:hypothetical protein
VTKNVREREKGDTSHEGVRVKVTVN